MNIDESARTVTIKLKGRRYPVRIWNSRVDPPLEGSEFGLDTETYMIESPASVPPMVIMQICNGESVDIVTWEKVPEYLRALESYNDNPVYYMLNAPFDLRVAANEHLYRALDADRVLDVGHRHRLYKLSVQGYYEEPVSLANLCKWYLHMELPKPVKTRTGFTREMTLTAEDVRYAAMDAAVTLAVSREMPEMPREALQTKADFTLDITRAAGILVDKPAWDRRRKELDRELEDAIAVVRSHGFEPDPKAHDGASMVRKFCDIMDLPKPSKVWSPPKMRGVLYLMMSAKGPDFHRVCKDVERHLPQVMMKGFKLSKDEHKALEDLLKTYGMEDVLTVRKSRPFAKVLLELAERLRDGRSRAEALKELGPIYLKNGGWEDDSAFQSPKAFLQARLEALENAHGVQFPRTPTGQRRMSKEENWILDSIGVKDEFLEAYVKYKHIEKLISTYLNEEHIWRDGRVHARYSVIKSTGRTSCSGPNLQNIPGGDGIRELYAAPPGCVLVSIDYNQLELCSLAQHCYTTYGYSRMRELINAGLDLHSWFAGKSSLRLIDDGNDYDGTEERRLALLPLLAMIKREHPGARKLAKEANFGFPGGMGAKRFLQGLRVKGIYDFTLKQAEDLRTSWIDALPEMELHMRPVECGPRDGGYGDHVYEAVTLDGLKRRYCSFCSALNLPFQGLAASGAKRMLWEMLKAGFKIVAFIHDEVLLEMPEEGMHERVLNAQRIMREAMAEVIPDVRIGTEAVAMYHWCKEAETLYDEEGRLKVWIPESITSD